MDTNAIKEKKKILDGKEKSKDVFERNGEELKLDCIYENSPLGFEKLLLSGLKDQWNRHTDVRLHMLVRN